MVAKILGGQSNFSYGEVDLALKRADEHPARKAGLRQAANTRILNSGALQDRPGRRALYPVTNNGIRTERFTISSGNVFDIQFAPGRLKIINSAGIVVANFANQGNGAALPWATAADINSISFAILGLSIYICFGHAMRPQVVSWDAVSVWSIADYNELVTVGGQKRTQFYRITPQNVVILPSGQTGVITVGATPGIFTPAHVGTRIRFVGRQILITGYVSPILVNALVEEPLPGAQGLGFAVDPRTIFSLGDEVIGSVTGSKGVVTTLAPTQIIVQLLSQNTTAVSNGFFGGTTIEAFTSADTAVGPGGSLQITSVSGLVLPTAPIAVWDDEVMNDFRGYPASCFVDQFRLGFCDFPSVPGGLGWSAINSPNDLYVGANPSNAMFEIAPAKARVFHVVPGPESSEFVFCDRALYYIPISPTNPLKPGSVAFQLLSGDGCAQIRPRQAQEAILYVNAGQNSVMAVIATGAYLRPFNTKNLSEFHFHLFNGIAAIAAPSADGTFNERYAYVLNGDGSIAVGKYNADSLATNAPVIGWVPWSGAGAVSWIGAYAADVVFTSSYAGGATIVEILDDTQYLDCALPVNAAPAAFAAPVGKGPLWLFPNQTVSLMDQSTRSMGTYQIDANGNIIPQGNGGENLAIASLIAGQPWTMTIEPFVPDAAPGNDVGQRMFKRRVARFAAYVAHSSGFIMGRLFAGPITPTSPALGTLMNSTRFPAWNQGDDATKPPPQRETAERIRPLGRAFDPRVAVIKDTPGPLVILEIGIEATV